MSNLPAYMLIRQYVIEMVFSRRNRSEPLPTERELCARFQVSRTVVRMALDDLRHDGFLKARARHGLFIAPDCDSQQQPFPDFCCSPATDATSSLTMRSLKFTHGCSTPSRLCRSA